MEAFIAITAISGSFVMVTLIFLMITQTRRRRYELHAEVQSKLIERFNSSKELVEFMESPAGRSFVNGVQRGNEGLVRNRILGGFQRAVMLTFLGLAFMVIWGIYGDPWMAWPGIILLALGIGNLVATWISLKMSKEPENAAAGQSPMSNER